MIRILLDECLPVKLKHRFREADPLFDASTVNDLGWNGIQNGKLLELAQQEFDILVTTDQNIPHQQRIANFSISIIAFRTKSNRYKDLLPHLSEACDLIRNCKSGMFYAIPEIRERG